MKKIQPETFTTEQAAKLSGATLRQLQWWDEQSFIRARRDLNGYRSYTREQIDMARDLHRLPGKCKARLALLWRIKGAGKTVDEALVWLRLFGRWL